MLLFTPPFLNHLYDDEQLSIAEEREKDFLNHLYDDELSKKKGTKQSTFLNHLYDDEHKHSHVT